MQRISDLILRAGLAFAFLYPPLDAIVDPNSWIGYLPSFVRGYAPDIVVLHAFGIFEIMIAFWILSGKRIAIPSFIACGVLIVIVLLNLSSFEVVFRDLSIASIALALGISRLHSRTSQATA